MRWVLLMLVSTVCVATASEDQLQIVIPRHSMHIGEVLECQVHLLPGYRDLLPSSTPLPNGRGWSAWNHPDNLRLVFPLNPSKPGTNMVGPIELKIGTLTLKAPAVPVLVLPDPGTNDLFEIRIGDGPIHKNESIEVVAQMRHFKRIPNPYGKAEPIEHDAHYLAKARETDEWTLRETYSNRLGHAGGSDAQGDYTIEGRLEVYQFTPKKAGVLTISKELFRNLPADYVFVPKKIAVLE